MCVCAHPVQRELFTFGYHERTQGAAGDPTAATAFRIRPKYSGSARGLRSVYLPCRPVSGVLSVCACVELFSREHLVVAWVVVALVNEFAVWCGGEIA